MRFTFFRSSGTAATRLGRQESPRPGAAVSVVEMLPLVVVVVVAFACASCSRSSGRVAGADDFFPEALAFEWLGLTDAAAVNGSDENRDETAMMMAGDLNDALTTMNFHREKMNDYLCRQYVVEGILQKISKGSSSSSESRSIASGDDRGTSNTLAMHTDQGSSAYNAWLIKTKLLKRIYDEYDLNVKMYEKPVGFALSNTNNNSSEMRPRDHEAMKNSRDVAKNPERPKQHLHEDSFPSETISVDIAQSHSTQYDLSGGADGGHNNNPPPNLLSHYGPPESHTPTQSPQQQHPLSSYGPPSPLSSYEPHSLLHPDTSYKELHTQPDTYGGPPPYSHSSYKPSSHSSHHESPDSSYGPPSHSSHRPSHLSHHESSHSSHGPPHSSYELLPHTYSYETPHLSYDYHFVPPTDYGPPTMESGPNHSTGEEETPDGSDEETNNSDGDILKQGLTATDLYDLTLTAVAFLGFGTFVMNLIMDAMAIQSGATLMMNSSPLLGVGVSRDDKHAPVHPIVSEIDELALIAVSAMDNMMANVDGIPVDCTEVKQLCRRSELLVKTGVNFSSKLLPIWNVSLGWLSKKLGKDTGQPVISALLGHCALSSQCQ